MKLSFNFLNKWFAGLILLFGLFITTSASACSWSWDWNNGCYENNNRMIQEGNGSNGGNIETNIVYLPPKPTQYGAVALNEHTGAYGFSSNQASEKRSKQEAVNDCGENGCKIIAHYSNQCVAFAWGAVGNSGYSSVKVGLNKTTAEENALVSCHTGAANCSIIYSGCSLP